MDIYASTKGIKAIFLLDDCYGFKKGEIYNAILPKSKFGKKEVICVIDKFGEEYAYPRDWFKIIET